MPQSGGDGASPAPSYAYTEVFNEVFPCYLAIGMTYDQFWNQDVELVKAYREADKIKRDLRNQDMWIQGAYIYEAILDAAPVLRFSFSDKPQEPIPYRSEPFPLFESKGEKKKREERNKEKQMEKIANSMNAWMRSANKKFEEKGGEENG